MDRGIPAVLIAATGSGCGKTTVTVALLQALKNRGKRPVSFKCGPDFIDPMFHRKVLGIPSSNLDLFFSSGHQVRKLMRRYTDEAEGNIAVIEGVMGYYDGIGGNTSGAGAWHLACETGTPSVLVVDGRGKSLSVCAEIKGFLDFEKDSRIKGIIFNRVSEGMYPLLKDMVEKRLGIPVCGYMPAMDNLAFESRHLGLVTADEIGNLKKIIEKLGEKAEECLDIERILEIAQGSCMVAEEEPCESEKAAEEKLCGDDEDRVRIGLSEDRAFCFWYHENTRELEKAGAEIVSFSPLDDSAVPENLDGLILCGGYPELHLERIQENSSMRESVREAVEDGMPCIAECGGFIYLHDTVEDAEGRRFRGAGVLDGNCYPLGRLGRFGYIDVKMEKDSVIGPAGTEIKAHEFHYWESDDPGKGAEAVKPSGSRKWKCIRAEGSLFAGFPHLWLASSPEAALCFVEKCREYRKKKEK